MTRLNPDETPVCAVCHCPIDEQDNGYCEEHQLEDEDEELETLAFEVTDADRDEIALRVKEGYNSGLIDRDGQRVTWVLTLDVFAL